MILCEGKDLVGEGDLWSRSDGIMIGNEVVEEREGGAVGRWGQGGCREDDGWGRGKVWDFFYISCFFSS